MREKKKHFWKERLLPAKQKWSDGEKKDRWLAGTMVRYSQKLGPRLNSHTIDSMIAWMINWENALNGSTVAILVISLQKWDVCENKISPAQTVQKNPRSEIYKCKWLIFCSPLGRFKNMLFTYLWKYSVIYSFACDRHWDYVLLRHIM